MNNIFGTNNQEEELPDLGKIAQIVVVKAVLGQQTYWNNKHMSASLANLLPVSLSEFVHFSSAYSETLPHRVTYETNHTI